MSDQQQIALLVDAKVELVRDLVRVTAERDAYRTALETISRHDDWEAVLGKQPSPQAIARAVLVVGPKQEHGT